MMVIIKTDGSMEPLVPKGKRVSLQEMQNVVGGLIEMVNLSDKVMILNEEGKIFGLPLNHKATVLFQRDHGHGDVIVGDVILADFGDID